MKSLRFRRSRGDQDWMRYGGTWVTKKLSNGEFDYAMVLEVINLDEAMGQDNKRKKEYDVSVSVVAPDEFEQKISALESAGIDSPWDALDFHQKVDIIYQYAGGARVFNDTSRNVHILLARAKKDCDIIPMLLGFYLDKKQNRIGATGWDVLKGNLVPKSFTIPTNQEKHAFLKELA